MMYINSVLRANCSVNFSYLQHLDNVDAAYTSHDVREDDQAQYYHQGQ